MAEITAAVLASNNETIIARCLNSVSWADRRLVILDDRSTDHTAEICRNLGARVVMNRFQDFCQQRNFGFEQADTEWLFYIDSDEEATEALGTGNPPGDGGPSPRRLVGAAAQLYLGARDAPRGLVPGLSAQGLPRGQGTL